MARLALACLLAMTACDGERERPAPTPPSVASTPAPSAVSGGSKPKAASASASPLAIPSITRMRLSDAPRLRFDATTKSGARLRVTLAGREQPNPHRRALAYFKLSRALNLDVVPTTHHASLPLRSLRQLVAAQPEALDLVRREAVINNDGTITALLEQQVAGAVIKPTDDRVARLAGLAATTTPIPSSDARMVRDYVAVVVLDFLAANVIRQSVLVDEAGKRVYASDNGDAFPGLVTPASLDLVLERLKPFRRFPRGLKRALSAFDQAAARATLVAKRQEDQLFGPRQLADLLDRRAALLTLLQSRVLQYGEAEVLSL